MQDSIPSNLAELLGAAAPDLDWLRAPGLVTTERGTFWVVDASNTAASIGEALGALERCGFMLDHKDRRHGCPRVVRR